MLGDIPTPVETLYAGHRFRSRLEARWAVFFDCLGIVWEYEPEGYALDEETWYVTAYWHEHGKAVLLKTSDGEQFEMVSQIWEGEHNDETDFEFLPDGRILASGRLEAGDGLIGDDDACTLLSVAEPPSSSEPSDLVPT